MTETMTAADVVSQYLANRRGGRGEFETADNIIRDATRAIVAEMPDGFRRRDVVNCVKTLTADTEELREIKPYRRTLVAGKTIDGMVESGELAAEDGAYHHVGF